MRFDKSDIEQSIPDRFEQVVRRHPDRVAVRAEGRSLSYRSLNEWSNQIAHAILEGLGPGEEPIVLLLDQGVLAVATIVGALKAGKVYVALEPSAPVVELRRVIEDCRPALVLTDEQHEPLTSELAGAGGSRWLSVQAARSNRGRANPGLVLSPDRLAYIFYTSGSTGVPKGVADVHRNVLHNARRYTNNLGITVQDRLSLIQSCSFSGTVSSLFSALLNGAAVCPFDLQREGVERMARWLNREGVTVFHSVPMIFDQLVGVDQRHPTLRLIRLEGDQTQRRHVVLFRHHFENGCVLVNGLGATETGIVRQFFMTHDTDVSDNGVPIGYAVEDMDVRLLDETGGDVASGTVGEIVVRSRYLARGYWRRPDLTKATFLPDATDPHARIYRTGDMGRHRPDGCLEYLGRKDLQTKLRGLRVDLPAVESALHGLSSIERAVALVREDRPGVQWLVAYLVPAVWPAPTVSAVRRGLASSMPAAMIPGRYVFLDALPLDRHRKVARCALPAPGPARPPLDQPFAPPTTPRQRAIAACFREVLALEAVGLHDDFFELGGDSLLATELLLVIEKRLGTSCPSECLFDGLTVAAIESKLEEQLGPDGPARCLVDIQPCGTCPPLFCLHNHVGHVLEYGRLAQLMGPDQPVFGLQNLSLGQPGQHTRVEDLAAAYLSEVLRAQPTGPYHLCGNCFGGVVAFELARQLRNRGRQVALLALIDTAFPSGRWAQLVRHRALVHHGHRLAQLPSWHRGRYLAGILMRLARRAGAMAGRHMRSALARLVWGRAHSVLRPGLTVVEANQVAEARYHPGGYDGAVVLLCVGPPHNHLGWKRVLGQNLTIIELRRHSETDPRPHLVQDPYVRDVAGLLGGLLSDSVGRPGAGGDEVARPSAAHER